MSFTKLQDRINNLPLVLAGPIVRRVQPESVTVWVALRHSRRIRIEIYDGDPPGGAKVADGEANTVAVGVNLHIACVTAKPKAGPLAAGATFQYDLFFDHLLTPDEIPSGLSLFGPQIVSASKVAAQADAEAHTKITYAKDGGPKRPTFTLPPAKLDELRILHGSCRKVAGLHTDALEAADQILRDAFRGNDRRPQMLFLTGDNIYNDGCERDAFHVVHDAALTLLGWDEDIPDGGPLSEMDAGVTSGSPGTRNVDTLIKAGVTNFNFFHLFGLGEIIALYLLVFADVLWPEDLDYRRKAFDFRGTLPAVRRALANVATYTIFDDHEVSDHWNINAYWVELILSKPMGRRIYQNALVAYALCQGWGNDPAQFTTGPGKELLDAIAAWGTAEIGGISSPDDPLDRIERCCGLPTLELFRKDRDWSGFHKDDEVVRWHYTVPCPNLNIDVLDAYMWRSYAGSTDNSVIITEEGLNRQIDTADFPQTECSLIVVSNVAIDLPGRGERMTVWKKVGWTLLTYLPYLLLPLTLITGFLFGFWLPVVVSAAGAVLGPYWAAAIRAAWPDQRVEFGSSYEPQTRAFELLMSRAAHRAPQLGSGKRQSRVVFLSGDVHHNCCMRMEYWSETPFNDRIPFGFPAAPVEGVLAQLVSSPCKYKNPARYDEKPGDADIHYWAGWREKPALTWTSEPDTSPWRFKESPWMMEYDPKANQPRMNPIPDWRYSLTSVAQESAHNNVPLEIPDRAAPTLDEKFAEMKSVSPQVILDNAKANIIAVNNLADVIFDWTPGQKKVIQRVWWRARPNVDPNWTVSRFVVSMEPPPSPPPVIT